MDANTVPCKNCNTPLHPNASFCPHCGAKVAERITLKSLLKELVENVFGWDNKYFVTIKGLFISPGEVLASYLGGTRKRFMPPIGFLLVGLTLAIFVFNAFKDEYLAISENNSIEQTEWMAEKFGGIYAEESYKKETVERTIKIQEFILKYLNVFTLLLIPLYSLCSRIVFGKRYNYGEHLVINSYLQGLGFLFSVILFLAGIFIHPGLYIVSIVPTFLMYSYAFKQLCQLSFGELFLKIMVFIGVMLGFALTIIIIAIAIGIGYTLLTRN